VAREIIVSEILDRYAHGEKVSAKEAQAVVAAVAGVRQEFLEKVRMNIEEGDRRHPTYQVFLRVLQDMGDLLGRNGIVTGNEMSKFWTDAVTVQ
jgi:hypothetical protein